MLYVYTIFKVYSTYIFNICRSLKNHLIYFYIFRVIYKLLASKSESIWVQALKVLGYFLKHLGHK